MEKVYSWVHLTVCMFLLLSESKNTWIISYTDPRECWLLCHSLQSVARWNSKYIVVFLCSWTVSLDSSREMFVSKIFTRSRLVSAFCANSYSDSCSCFPFSAFPVVSSSRLDNRLSQVWMSTFPPIYNTVVLLPNRSLIFQATLFADEACKTLRLKNGKLLEDSKLRDSSALFAAISHVPKCDLSFAKARSVCVRVEFCRHGTCNWHPAGSSATVVELWTLDRLFTVALQLELSSAVTLSLYNVFTPVDSYRYVLTINTWNCTSRNIIFVLTLQDSCASV